MYRGMAVSFNSLNYPTHTFGYKNMHRSRYTRRTNPAIAIPPSSILVQTNETGNLINSMKSPGPNMASTSSDSSGSLLGQGNTVGIIGGVSIDSTLNFMKKLVNWSTKDGEDCVPFVLCSDPVLSKELLSHKRSSFHSFASKNELLQVDHTVLEHLRRQRFFLENSGARCIVMPCHVSHTWHDEVSRECSVPFLHMGECMARELKEAKLRPLEAGSPLRIGVLATDATLAAGFYQEKLQNEGFEVVQPDKATMEHAVLPAIEALNRRDMEGARNLLRIALQVLLVRAVNTVVLASDDMRELLPQDDPLLKKCVDPMDALARSTVKWARSAGKGT
ncbi:Aspartate racemase [Actinidia chinensis var. chinensis]|uniref:Aspartate racemase n=1 Tax=Actinidia chinensis var. chinensis TaxID=1590841 RepID=A0A2R6QFR5_ACTCC|nr:Aspartate racemase [Actinidia chinensis var. chinensis]